MKSSALFVHFFISAYRIIYLNLIWLGFVLIGGVVFGLFPACSALVQVLNRHSDQSSDIKSDFVCFKQAYKAVFIFFNKVALLFYLVLGILVVNLVLSLQIETLRSLFFFIDLLLLIVLGFGVSFWQLLFYHYACKRKTTLKAFLIETWIYAFVDLKGTILLIGSSCLLSYLFFYRFPALLIFGGVVLLFKLNQKIAVQMMQNVEAKIKFGVKRHGKNDQKKHQGTS